MGSTTPVALSKKVARFCRSISKAEPVLLPLTPVPDARPGHCHLNVLRHVDRHGGKIVYGWVIWTRPDLYDAEFHSVWSDPRGELHDITPRADGEETVLFLPDPARELDIPNRLSWSNRCWIPASDLYVNSGNGLPRFRVINLDFETYMRGK